MPKGICPSCKEEIDHLTVRMGKASCKLCVDDDGTPFYAFQLDTEATYWCPKCNILVASTFEEAYPLLNVEKKRWATFKQHLV